MAIPTQPAPAGPDVSAEKDGAQLHYVQPVVGGLHAMHVHDPHRAYVVLFDCTRRDLRQFGLALQSPHYQATLSSERWVRLDTVAESTDLVLVFRADYMMTFLRFTQAQVACFRDAAFAWYEGRFTPVEIEDGRAVEWRKE